MKPKDKGHLFFLYIGKACSEALKHEQQKADYETRKLVHSCFDLYNHVISAHIWVPKTQISAAEMRDVRENLVKWADFVRQEQILNNNLALVVIMLELLDAQLQRTNSKKKTRILKTIKQQAQKLHNIGDPDGIEFGAFEQTKSAMDYAYELARWWQ